MFYTITPAPIEGEFIPKQPELLTPQQLHDYQKYCVMHQLANNDSMLWLGMGLGKTPITLTTIVDRMRAGLVQKTLIFGPLRVVQAVWSRESRKWTHTKHLRFSIMHGNKDKRLRALFANADIYLINYENMNWLAETLDHYWVSQNKPIPFQMVVYDEVTKMKNTQTARVKGGKRERKGKNDQIYTVNLTGWRKFINLFKYRTGLTGTPHSNGYIDLHGQYLAVDGGKRLGSYITHYRDSYFLRGFDGWTYVPSQAGKELIEQKIADITVNMNSRDYLDLPPVTISNIMVDLPPKIMKAYKELEKEMFTQLDSGKEIEVFSRSSVSIKCLQFCNGSVYLRSGCDAYEELHSVKLEALEDIIEEAGESPVLCSYTFVPDAMRIMKHFKRLKPVNLTTTPSKDTEKVIDKWNNGKIGLLIGHPASMGHGIDGLQEAGHIAAWYGINWSLELYEQFNARVDRQGQPNPVLIPRILCNNTIDLAVADAITRKTDDQAGLRAAIERYRKGYITNDLDVNFF